MQYFCWAYIEPIVSGIKINLKFYLFFYFERLISPIETMGPDNRCSPLKDDKYMWKLKFLLDLPFKINSP